MTTDAGRGSDSGDDRVTASDESSGRLDIDVRFLLANERTLLAWLRTALTLMAGGVALTQLAHDRLALQAIGLGLLVLGAIGCLIGYARFRATGRAIRSGQLPAPGHGAALMTAAVVILAVVLIIVYLLG
jgi:putative membrane protein